LTIFAGVIAVMAACWLVMSWKARASPTVDEAMAVGKTASDFPQADQDYFHDMDGAIALRPSEIEGRDTWMVWSAGDDAFWDYLADNSYGAVDLLKILSSSPSLPWRGRDDRFRYMGLMNEPGFVQATGPDPNRYGLWLDKRIKPADPFENASKYPGVNGGSFYGAASGIVGLRLFPNPAFDEAARRKWDPVRYYGDPAYYRDKDLVRPYRVGMSCAFCHASFDPLRPPADPEHPQWRNLSTYVGAQYFRFGRIFFTGREPHNFVWQLVQSAPPGTADTSLIASDGVNDPRTMNGIYDVLARLVEAQEQGAETLSGGELDNDQLGSLPGYTSFVPPDAVHAPHVLKDGADSVGVLGALERVYVSIGEDHEEWVRHFQVLVGGSQSPFEVSKARGNSSYFVATSQRVSNLALFFVKAARPFHLKDAPGGARYMTQDVAVLKRGKIVFADNCAICHSSKQPPNGISIESGRYFAWMRAEVLRPDFLQDNYLSTDRRYPITDIGTNACTALASNAIAGHVWDNFSSDTYKHLAPAGAITVLNPIDGSPYRWTLPGGGRGYVRVPSLISIWSSAPFFQNNSLGKFINDPSVAARMPSFEDSIGQLLWPDRRTPEIHRTTDVSYITIPAGYFPDFLQGRLSRNVLGALLPGFYKDDMIQIGPIPKGTPINLIANIDLSYPDRLRLLHVLLEARDDLGKINAKHLDERESADLLKSLVPDLLSVSTCPDFVTNRGHTFGAQLGDSDKRALVEFLKTF
jgi:hypothetical protein